jgi:hypothetical protein
MCFLCVCVCKAGVDRLLNMLTRHSYPPDESSAAPRFGSRRCGALVRRGGGGEGKGSPERLRDGQLSRDGRRERERGGTREKERDGEKSGFRRPFITLPLSSDFGANKTMIYFFSSFLRPRPAARRNPFRCVGERGPGPGEGAAARKRAFFRFGPKNLLSVPYK